MARSFANARKTKQKKFSSVDRQLLQGFDQESDNGHSKAPHAKRERMKEKRKLKQTNKKQNMDNRIREYVELNGDQNMSKEQLRKKVKQLTTKSGNWKGSQASTSNGSAKAIQSSSSNSDTLVVNIKDRDEDDFLEDQPEFFHNVNSNKMLIVELRHRELQRFDPNDVDKTDSDQSGSEVDPVDFNTHFANRLQEIERGKRRPKAFGVRKPDGKNKKKKRPKTRF